MQLKAYTVFDNKALQYHPPFYAATDGSAVRSFSDMANDNNTMIGRHPKDYSLWHCGTYNDQNGHFAPVLPLVHVADAVAFLNVQPTFPLTPAESKEALEAAINGKAR